LINGGVRSVEEGTESAGGLAQLYRWQDVVVDPQKTENTEKLIAIVEDDVHLATLFQDLLHLEDHWRLHIFNDGQSAKDQIPELAPHLILLDVGLPGLDGASLFKILRGHSNTKNTPIIVITASHDWELHRMGLQSGFLLRKPFQMQELLFIVRALLCET
jgi:DNA-binding response OmpR family regulator